MVDWAPERAALRAWLHPNCRSRAEFEFYDDLFDDLTDMFDEMMSNDPVLWYAFTTADNTATQDMAFLDRRRFLEEAWERGYELD